MAFKETDRVLGLDFGDKTIGVAVSDPLGLTAQGLETIRRGNSEEITGSIERIKEIMCSYGVKTIVLGFPVNMNNTQGEQCRKTLEFKENLEKSIPGSTVLLADERLTTALAGRILLEGDVSRRKRNKVIDKLAATVILQSYLDRLYYKNQYGSKGGDADV